MPPDSSNDDQEQRDHAASTSALKERRFKLSRACDRCRRRRIKCDEGHPCQACLTASAACTFEEPGKRTHPHKSKRTASLENRMHQLETLIQAIPPAVFAASGVTPPNLATLGQSPEPSISISTNSQTQTAPQPHSPVAPPFGAGDSGIPPPSLHVFPLMNPSTHFTAPQQQHTHRRDSSPGSALRAFIDQRPTMTRVAPMTPEQLAEETGRMSLSSSYLYFDDAGYTRWQGQTSGLPLLDMLVDCHTNPAANEEAHEESASRVRSVKEAADARWFPDRTPKRADMNPETLWRLITSYIVPDLMDSLVQCFLSTSYYILPFIHVPTFLADYGNPQKWGEPGFGAFIVAVCCLASRHIDDPRVRQDPADGISTGKHWFELFGKLRTLPISDFPTLYTIQADLIAGVYAVGLGKLSKAASLFSEAITTCVDAGLHRSTDTYDCFDPIEDEVRKRTFWCVYIWDKQLAAHFGRPSLLRLRDCDVGEPTLVDDEYITREQLGMQPAGTESRMSAFVCGCRIMVVLEAVLDAAAPPAPLDENAPFLTRAAAVLGGGPPRVRDMRDELALLDEIHRTIPPTWAHTHDTLSSDDVIRVTQAARLHSAEQFVRLLIHRHRFTEMIAGRLMMANGVGEGEQSEKEREEMMSAQQCALKIVATHLAVATRGLMTYFGVHVIHQLTQAGRTLMAILLNCKAEPLHQLIPSSLEALRSCVGLLRRFSGRYVCGLRSGDLLEEFCRLTSIPLEPSPRTNDSNGSSMRVPWIRPIRRKAPSVPRSNQSESNSSPEAFSPSDFFVDPPASPQLPYSMSTTSSMSTSTNAMNAATSPLSSSAGYMDSTPGATGSMSIDQTTGMYGIGMPSNGPADVLSFFDEGQVDVAGMFNTDFMQPPAQTNGNGIQAGYGQATPPANAYSAGNGHRPSPA